MKPFSLFWLAICLVVAVTTACTQSSTATGYRATGTDTVTASPTAQKASATLAPDAPTITISGMAFGDPITVPPGAVVTIVNDDSVEHSVTSQAAGQFDVHVDGNEQGTLTAPTAPGEYPFHCVYHPSMTGTLIVGV